jgi:hypothetical protein
MQRPLGFAIFSKTSPPDTDTRDYPHIPWALGNFSYESLLTEFHTKPLAQLLEAGNPELFQRWYYVVFKAAHAVKNAEEELKALNEQQGQLAEQTGELEAALENLSEIYDNPDDDIIPIEMPDRPILPSWHQVLTIGLSLMLFLGLSEYFGLDIQSLSFEQIPILILAVAGAVCINLAEYIGLSKMVKATRRYDPPRSPQDDPDHLDILHFMKRFRDGDSANWIALTMVVLETSFAAPGLISLLPPKTAAQPLFQVTVFAACGLAALVNLVMAWGHAIEEIHWEQTTKVLKEQERQEQLALRQDEHYQERKELLHQERKQLAAQKLELSRHLGKAKAGFHHTQKMIDDQQHRVAKLGEDALAEFRRWELEVKRWMQDNPKILKNFEEAYPIWQGQASTNGHHAKLETKIDNSPEIRPI